VILTFHGICDNRCTNVNSMSTSIFTAFLDWLGPRAASGTVVRTVGQAMGATPPPGPDTTPPVTSIACNGAACSSWYRAPVTVTLSATDIGGSGVARTVSTTDGSDPNGPGGIVYTGPFTVTQSTTVRFSWTDTSPPYQYRWNTRKVALGQHTLTAVATDGADNTTTSAAVAVTTVK